MKPGTGGTKTNGRPIVTVERGILPGWPTKQRFNETRRDGGFS